LASAAGELAGPGNAVIGMAVIKADDFSFALSWKTLTDLPSHGGIDALLPREVLGQAFATDMPQDSQLWIDKLEQRHQMAYPYELDRASEALSMVQDRFAPALLNLATDPERRSTTSENAAA